MRGLEYRSILKSPDSMTTTSKDSWETWESQCSISSFDFPSPCLFCLTSGWLHQRKNHKYTLLFLCLSLFLRTSLILGQRPSFSFLRGHLEIFGAVLWLDDASSIWWIQVIEHPVMHRTGGNGDWQQGLRWRSLLPSIWHSVPNVKAKRFSYLVSRLSRLWELPRTLWTSL